jgi:phosphatidylglycerol:prolipoprotein diacylglycerol transferase
MFPNLFKIGPFTLHSYGLFLALGFLAGMRMSMYYAKREKMEPSQVTDLILYIFVAGLIGAKLLHLAIDFDYYRQDWSRLLAIYQVGGVFYGGLIAALLTSFWFIRKRKLDTWRTIDLLVMGVATGQIFGRIGCFLAGCCWGKECYPGFPLAVIFSRPEAADQVGTPLNVPLHPTQLYEAIPMIGVVLILMYSYNHRKFTGQQLCVYLLLYSVLRFTVEIFRGDPRGFLFDGMLSTSQFISLIAFAGGIAIYLIRGRKVMEPGVGLSKNAPQRS